jgi:hypothetical protein
MARVMYKAVLGLHYQRQEQKKAGHDDVAGPKLAHELLEHWPILLRPQRHRGNPPLPGSSIDQNLSIQQAALQAVGLLVPLMLKVFD